MNTYDRQKAIQAFMDKGPEYAALGSMLLDSNTVPEVMKISNEEDFYWPDVRQLVKYMKSLYARKNGDAGCIDAVLLRSFMQVQGVWKDEYMQVMKDSLDHTPFAENAGSYARITHEQAMQRQLYNEFQKWQEIVLEHGSSRDKVEAILKALLQLMSNVTDNEVINVKDHVWNAWDNLKTKRRLITTGYNAIDSIVEGIDQDQFVIVAGRPSMGKSSLALGMAARMAKAGERPLIASLEMGQQGLLERLLSIEGHVQIRDFKSNGETNDQTEAMCTALDVLQGLDIYILDKPKLTVSELLLNLKEYKTKHNISCVIVDYIQLLRPVGKVSNRQEAITQITRDLKLIPLEQHIPVIALSQLNRANETRRDNRPKMSDLRESGSIEQDADIIILIHREDYYRIREADEGHQDGEAEIIIAKNKQGPTGTAKLSWIGEYFLFDDRMIY